MRADHRRLDTQAAHSSAYLTIFGGVAHLVVKFLDSQLYQERHPFYRVHCQAHIQHQSSHHHQLLLQQLILLLEHLVLLGKIVQLKLKLFELALILRFLCFQFGELLRHLML